MVKKFMLIHPKDNVVVMLEKSCKGDTFVFQGKEITLLSDVEFAHKVAVKDFEVGDPVLKYGEEIGIATVAIPTGEWIHDHNIVCLRGK